MTDQHHFAIRQHPDYHHKATCPICRLEFRVRYLDIYEVNNQPICNPCAWEKTPALANLLKLVEAVEGYERGGVPDHVSEVLTQRQNDPARLKKELQNALDSLDNHGHGAPETTPIRTSPLAKLVAEQITAALDSEDVDTMKQAIRLHEECPDKLTSDIPF